jgi:ubiquinone/menaquinone biosynthesis C-methylase UbiE
MKLDEKEAQHMYKISATFYHDYRTIIHPQGWFFNEHLEMPTTLSLLGSVKNKKVLDYGCGSGIYASLLARKGAIVKGFDISHEMLKIAREKNPSLDLRQGSGYNIPFHEQFDIIIAPLVIHYMNNLDAVFKEMSRVLKPKGFVIFSTGNPVYEVNKSIRIRDKKYKVLGVNDYFKESVFYK